MKDTPKSSQGILYSTSEVELMDHCHVILETYCVTENRPLSLTDRIGPDNELPFQELAQVDILDMVPHVRHTLGFPRPLLMKLLVAKTEYALGLLAHEGKLIMRGRGVEGDDGTSRQFLLKWIFACSSRPRPAVPELLPRCKRE